MNPIAIGWICPVCGAGVAPATTICYHGREALLAPKEGPSTLGIRELSPEEIAIKNAFIRYSTSC